MGKRMLDGAKALLEQPILCISSQTILTELSLRQQIFILKSEINHRSYYSYHT